MFFEPKDDYYDYIISNEDDDAVLSALRINLFVS
jgi:hypothetical protein